MTDDSKKIMNDIHKSSFEFLIWDGISRQDTWDLNILSIKLSDWVRITKDGIYNEKELNS